MFAGALIRKTIPLNGCGLRSDYPDVQAMLDEAVQGKHGGDRKSENIKMDNVQLDIYQGGNSRAAGLRKLRKYAEENPEVAQVYQP